jgi:DNA-binding CsgD family transcriptional regulator
MQMILTQRERTILKLKRQNLSIKSIAGKLETSESAIAFHLKNIRTKQNLYYNDSIQKHYLVNVSASFFS